MAFQLVTSTGSNWVSGRFVKKYSNSLAALVAVPSGAPPKMPTFMWSWVGMSHSKAEKISLLTYAPLTCIWRTAGISYCAMACENGSGPPTMAVPFWSRVDGRRWLEMAVQSRLFLTSASSSTLASRLWASSDSTVWTCRSPVVHLPVAAAGVGLTGVPGSVGLVGPDGVAGFDAGASSLLLQP